MSIDFGFSLQEKPAPGRVQQWLDEVATLTPKLIGHFKSLWITDHLFWDDRPTFECWTVISYLAGRFPQFDIGPVVLGQSYRNPALVAKMGATLQTLSGGRLILGIGAAWKEDEHRAYGYPYPSAGTRVAQLGDALEIIKRMWAQPGQVTYQGDHYSVVDAYCEPKPTPAPPIMVGGGGDKTTRLAAQYADWWNFYDAGIARYTERMKVLHRHCADLGRDPATLRLTWFGRLVVGKAEDEALARGGGKWTRDNAFVGTPAQIVEQLGPFIEAGVDYFMVEVSDVGAPDILDMILENVLPQVR